MIPIVRLKAEIRLFHHLLELRLKSSHKSPNKKLRRKKVGRKMKKLKSNHRAKTALPSTTFNLTCQFKLLIYRCNSWSNFLIFRFTSISVGKSPFWSETLPQSHRWEDPNENAHLSAHNSLSRDIMQSKFNLYRGSNIHLMLFISKLVKNKR